jgi:molecular chaperone HtpG
MKEVLKDAVSSVRSSKRLVDSPAVVVDQEQAMTRSMRHIMKQMRKEGGPEPEHKYDLELNPRHPVIVQLDQMRAQNAELASKVAEQIFDNARVAAGVLEDPRAMLKRMNELLQAVLETKK